MAQNREGRRKLSQVRGKYVEAVGGEQVEFEADDGTVFSFPHPLFADDDWQEQVDGASNNAEKARAVLGDEQYERFVEAGGRSSDIGLLLMDTMKQMQGALADGTPTRSSTS
jgi:hypothetical protein